MLVKGATGRNQIQLTTHLACAQNKRQDIEVLRAYVQI